MKTLEVIYPWFMGGVVILAATLFILAFRARKKLRKEGDAEYE